MRKEDAAIDLQRPSAEAAPRRADEVAEPVDGADGRLVERAHERRARQMGGMVFDHARPRAHAAFVEAERGRDRRRQRGDAREIAGAVADGVLRPVPEQEERLAPQVRAGVPRDGEQIDLGRADAGDPQALGERAMGEAGAVLDAAEPLLFHRRDELSFADEHGRDVSVVRVEADDDHTKGDGSPFRFLRTRVAFC